MIFIRSGKHAMTIQLEGSGRELFMEITSGAARILLDALKDECKNDPDILLDEARKFGNLVGEVMLKQLSMGKDIQEINLSPDRKGKTMN